MSAHIQNGSEVERRWFERITEMNNLIVGFGIGLGLLLLRLTSAKEAHGHGDGDAILDTILVAVFLTALVAYSRFQFPTLFAGRPRMATAAIILVAGHVSLLFDSFAVVLLLVTLSFKPTRLRTIGNYQFNRLVVVAAASVCALTVGAAFWLGELWAITHYMKSGYATVTAGLPLLLVLTPYNIVVAVIVARLFPLDVEPVAFDRHQVKEAAIFLGFLFLLIVTHDPILCASSLLLISFLRTDTERLLHDTLDELKHGAAPAIGLIVLAWIIKELPYGIAEYIEAHVHGLGITALAVMSSPFAGAMIKASENPTELYWNISWLMLGAPSLAPSSLVALIVFKEHVEWVDVPEWLKPWIGWLPGVKKNSHVQEVVGYTLVSIPLLLLLAVPLLAANHFGVFVAAYEWLATLGTG